MPILRKQPAIIFFLSVVLLTAICCARHGEAWDKLNVAESLMESQPDSALNILNHIPDSTLVSEEETARYALLKSMALDKNYIDTTSFAVIQPAIDYYAKHGSADEKMRTAYYQGRIFQNKRDKEDALRCFMDANEFEKQVSDTLTLGNILVAKGTIWYSMYRYENFVNDNLKAAQLYQDINNKDYEVSCLLNALDGSILLKNKERSDSILGRLNAFKATKPELDTWLHSYLLAYATEFENDDKIKEILKIVASQEEPDDITKLDIAAAYCKIGVSDKAIQYFCSIDTLSPVVKSLKYLAIKPDILAFSGRLADALSAYKNFSAKIDSIHQDIFTRNLLSVETRHEMEKDALIKVQKRDKIIWISLCVIITLIAITILVISLYRVARVKNSLAEEEKTRLMIEQQKLREENKRLELEKRNAELLCRQQALEADNRNLYIERLEAESLRLNGLLKEQTDLSETVAEVIKVRIEMLNALLATHITDNTSLVQTYDEWRDKLLQDKDEFMNTTRLAFKATHPKFIEELERHGLTDTEINYVCLYAIGLKGKDVGNYIQLKRHYHISSEIRKKLGLDEHKTNLGIYIRNLLKNS